MITLSKYDANGEIVSYQTVPIADLENDFAPLERPFVIGRYDKNTYIIIDGVAAARVSMGISVVGSLVTGVPPGTKVRVTSISHLRVFEDICTTGQIDMSACPAGEYEITLNKSPFEITHLNIKI